MISLLTKMGPCLAKKSLTLNLLPKSVLITQIEQFNCNFVSEKI